MVSEFSDAAGGIKGLIDSFLAHYTWYLRDGFPGVIALIVVVLLHGDVIRPLIESVETPGKVLGGLLLVVLAPAVGLLLGQGGFLLQWPEKLYQGSRWRSALLGGKNAARWLDETPASAQPPVAAFIPADADDWDLAWLRSRAPTALAELDRLWTTAQLLRALTFLAVLVCVDLALTSFIHHGPAISWGDLWNRILVLAGVVLVGSLFSANAGLYARYQARRFYWAYNSQPQPAAPPPPLPIPAPATTIEVVEVTKEIALPAT